MKSLFQKKELYRFIISLLILLLFLGNGFQDLISYVLKSLSTIKLSEYVQVFAATATMFTAYFSWMAIKQAEEIQFKPVIAVRNCIYSDTSKMFIIEFRNLSIEGDRWARDVVVKIVNTNFTAHKKGYIGPNTDCYFKLTGINNWEMIVGKIVEIVYLDFNMKQYKINYKIESIEAHGKVTMSRMR